MKHVNNCRFPLVVEVQGRMERVRNRQTAVRVEKLVKMLIRQIFDILFRCGAPNIDLYVHGE